MEAKYLYRCSRDIPFENANEETIDLYYDEFKIVSETDKSYLIELYRNKTKRVIKNCNGSFAHETKEKAFENFQYRTLRSLSISRNNYELAKMFYNKYVKK